MQMNRSTSHDTLGEMNALIEELDNPACRRMLEVVRDHYWAEVTWDIPAIMDTFAQTGPVVHQFKGGHFGGWDGVKTEGREAVQAFYETARDEGVTIGPMEQMNWTFGSNGTSVEALFFFVMPGKGMPNYTEPLDPEQPYLVALYQSVYFPFAGDLAAGETIYAADQPTSLDSVDEAAIRALIGE